jgi:ubiquinol-cytochrome c reductase cytochrome b subunit
MLQQALDWIEDRTGLVSLVEGFFEEEIPASSGWHQVFGSMALFALSIQFLTGILLAFNHSPQPVEAWYSVRYIMNEVTGGALVRGLHHWGASMMVILVGVHLVQVVIWGAYKKPREATWLVGVVLLMLTLAFGLTGYLLNWDNRAYWATVVTLQIMSLPPIGGQELLQALGSEGGRVGAVTFQRFYALHVILLPAATSAMAALHLFLVRKHGVAPQPGDESKPNKKFWPEQIFKDSVAIFIAFAVLFFVAATVEAPLGKMADPNDTSFVPRPEWYFLFLFQTLKFFEGPLEIVGAVILPTIAMLLLAALPFLDRGKLRKVTQRTTAIGGVALAAVGWIALTAAAVRSTPDTPEPPEGAGQAWTQATPAQLAGYAYFQELDCGRCHNVAPGGEPAQGPTFTAVYEPDPDRLKDHIEEKAPSATGIQKEALGLLATGLEPVRAWAIQDAPEEALAGAKLYQENQCGLCHAVNGEGAKTGPALNGTGERRDAEWLAGHFREPQKFVEGSMMPPYDFPEPQMEAMVAYMRALP